MILEYFFMFKVKYEPLRNLRLPPNFTGRKRNMSSSYPPKFSFLGPFFWEILTNIFQKIANLERF